MTSRVGGTDHRPDRASRGAAPQWGADVYAIYVEVASDPSNTEAARAALPNNAVPMARAAGAKAGFWLDHSTGTGVAVITFDSLEAAQAMADHLQVGEQPKGAPEGVTFKTVEVREVLAWL